MRHAPGAENLLTGKILMLCLLPSESVHRAIVLIYPMSTTRVGGEGRSRWCIGGSAYLLVRVGGATSEVKTGLTYRTYDSTAAT
jgi:hypothetical protein